VAFLPLLKWHACTSKATKEDCCALSSSALEESFGLAGVQSIQLKIEDRYSRITDRGSASKGIAGSQTTDELCVLLKCVKYDLIPCDLGKEKAKTDKCGDVGVEGRKSLAFFRLFTRGDRSSLDVNLSSGGC
jgi:hypothetical protein